MEVSEAANIGIASVSAVLWTGGLIVLQLCQVQHAKLEDDSNEDCLSLEQAEVRKERIAKSKRRIAAVRAGMALTAFGTLAPLFVLLFACTWWLRIFAIISAVVYVPLTANNIRTFWQTIRCDSDRAIAAAGFLLPTIAMITVAAFPRASLVAIESLLLDFLGYFILSGAAGFGSLNSR